MSNPERLLALGPGKPERRQNSGPIDSYNIGSYLLRVIPERDYQQFSDHLYMPILRPLLQEIETYDHEVYIHSDDERERILAEADDFFSPFLQEVMEINPEEERQQRANERAQGERFSWISYDTVERIWIAESPLGGTYERIIYDRDYFSQVLSETKLPSVDVHSHPRDALFSPVDYTDLITRVSGDQRYFRAAIVLCPSIKILALATKQTPMFDWREAQEWTQEWTKQVETRETPKLIKLRERMEAVDQHVETYEKSLEEDIAPQLAELEAMRTRFNLTNEECAEAFRAMLLQVRPSFIEDYTRHSQMRKDARKKYSSESRRLTNEQLIQLARDLNIRLYSSRNMMEFTAFSA